MLTVLFWYCLVGFLLAVAGDAFNALKQHRTGTPNPDERFYLADTVFVTVAWPLVLWVAVREVLRG